MNRLPSTDKLLTDAIEYTPDKIDAASWDHLLAAASNATPFHNLGWIRSIYETYPSIKVGVLVVKNEDGYLGGFPYTIRKKYGFLQWLDSLLFGTYGGPILHKNASPEVSRVLWNSFQRIARSSIDAVRIRDFHNSLQLEPRQGYQPRTVFTHRIPLHHDYDHLHKKIYTHNVRKMIRQSHDKGIYIEKVTTEEDVKEYVNIAYHTLKRHGSKLYPEMFFLNLFRHMGEHCLYHLAYHDGRAVAGTIHFVQGDSVYTWLPASYPEFWNLRPNNALVDHVIRWAVEHEKMWYDFGGGPSRNQNLINYKESFGAMRYDYCLWEWDSRFVRMLRKLHGRKVGSVS